jgi:hypothetical protein
MTLAILPSAPALDALGDGGQRRRVAALEADVHALRRATFLAISSACLACFTSMPTGFSQ